MLILKTHFYHWFSKKFYTEFLRSKKHFRIDNSFWFFLQLAHDEKISMENVELCEGDSSSIPYKLWQYSLNTSDFEIGINWIHVAGPYSEKYLFFI